MVVRGVWQRCVDGMGAIQRVPTVMEYKVSSSHNRETFDVYAAPIESEAKSVSEAFFSFTLPVTLWPLYPNEGAAIFHDCLVDFGDTDADRITAPYNCTNN